MCIKKHVEQVFCNVHKRLSLQEEKQVQKIKFTRGKAGAESKFTRGKAGAESKFRGKAGA